MGLREEVLRILGCHEISRIRFSFQSVHGTPVSVDPTTFMRVVSAIRENRIQITSEGVPASYGANYNGDVENGGVMHLRPIRDRRYSKSTVIHEAVHASFDLTRNRISGVDDELGAYLANTLYLRFTSYPLNRLGEDNPHSRRLYESLYAAAGSIIRDGTASEAQIERIRRRLVAHPVYAQMILSEGCSWEGEPCFYSNRIYNG